MSTVTKPYHIGRKNKNLYELLLQAEKDKIELFRKIITRKIRLILQNVLIKKPLNSNCLRALV
jgi:hypothetical protein